MGDDHATASSEPAPLAGAPADAGYPELQSVPPRPQLSYTVQQQRQIVDALIADRENARYTGQVVRHRSGLSSLPPPPTPPEPAAPLDLEPEIAGPAPEPSLVERETLVDFLGALLFDAPAVAPGAEPPAGPANEPDELSEAAPQALSDPPADQATRQAPVPPARSAVAARLAAAPDPIDALVDATVPQAPLPPGESALAARLAAADQLEAVSAAPLPEPRPAMARSAAATLPAPPPLKPILPASAPTPPRPAEKPDGYRSAAADALPRRALLTVAEAAR
jgi:hypothetical protein